MPLPEGIRRAFRLGLTRPRIAGDVDEEVAFHLQMRAEEFAARGLSPEAARAEALRRFGDVQRWSEAMGELDRDQAERARRAEWWSTARQDLRHTLRGLRRQPGFAAAVVLTMALGIGANATMFGVVDRLMLRAPAHVADAGRVRRVYFESPTGAPGAPASPTIRYAQFTAIRDSSRSFAQVAAWCTQNVVLGAGLAARQIRVGAATPSLFPLLGVRPFAGRFFTVGEDRPPAGTRVVVLGYDLWKRDLDGDPAAVGRTLRIGGKEYDVIGVAPPEFTGPDLRRIDAWIPLSVVGADLIGPLAKEPWYETRAVGWIDMLGRLAPGVDDARADAEMTLAYRRWLSAETEPERRRRIERARPRALVGPIQAELGPARSDNARVATWLGAVSFLVLLIACANVANLLLARAMRRRREIALRVALGAGRARLVAQLLTESVVLAALGGAAGLLLAAWGGGFVRTVLFPDVAWSDTLADPRVLAFTAAAALVTGVLAGLVPALQSGQPALASALKAGAREGGYQRSRTRTLLLVSQAALSVVLLMGAGLFVRSFAKVTSADLGFDAARVLVLDADLEEAGYRDSALVALYDQLYDRVRALPGVASASLAITTPFWTTMDLSIHVPGVDSIPELPGTGRPTFNAVTPEYFRTMGTRLLRGRGITDADRFGAPRVVVVNETMARLLWPGQDALGKCVKIGEGAADTIPCAEVVGVAQEARWNEIRPRPAMQYYVPLAQRVWSEPLRSLFVRPAADPASVVEAVRREVLAAAPRLAFARVRPLREYVEPEVRPWRLGASMFTAFGALALVLAALGLYSVLAYTVVQRSHEMGVRIALGAQTRDVLRLVVVGGLRIAAAGTALGLVVALAAARSIEGLLYGVSAHDPLVIALVIGTLLLAAAAASLIPAWRATRADPSAALRAE